MEIPTNVNTIEENSDIDGVIDKIQTFLEELLN